MADKTNIEWTKTIHPDGTVTNGATWNPVTGCTKVSAGCKHCYAERQWPRMTRLVPAYAGRAFTDVRCHPERLDQPLRWKRPRRIFVNSMSDLFHEAVPEDFILAVFVTMAAARQHTFQVLTKRTDRMRDLLTRWRDSGLLLREGCGVNLRNVWLGASIEDHPSADKRIVDLLKTPAAVHFISVEPLLGPVSLNLATRCDRLCSEFQNAECPGSSGLCVMQQNIDWVIVGGESGPKARPMHPDWVRSLRDQCAAAGVPFLFKQWGEWGPTWHEAHAYLGLGAPMDPAGIHSIAGTRMGQYPHESIWPVVKIGKKTAGRLLDGVLHDGYPVPRGGAA